MFSLINVAHVLSHTGYSGQDFDWADYHKQHGTEEAPPFCFKNVRRLFLTTPVTIAVAHHKCHQLFSIYWARVVCCCVPWNPKTCIVLKGPPFSLFIRVILGGSNKLITECTVAETCYNFSSHWGKSPGCTGFLGGSSHCGEPWARYVLVSAPESGEQIGREVQKITLILSSVADFDTW